MKNNFNNDKYCAQRDELRNELDKNLLNSVIILNEGAKDDNRNGDDFDNAIGQMVNIASEFGVDTSDLPAGFAVGNSAETCPCDVCTCRDTGQCDCSCCCSPSKSKFPEANADDENPRYIADGGLESTWVTNSDEPDKGPYRLWHQPGEDPLNKSQYSAVEANSNAEDSSTPTPTPIPSGTLTQGSDGAPAYLQTNGDLIHPDGSVIDDETEANADYAGPPKAPSERKSSTLGAPQPMRAVSGTDTSALNPSGSSSTDKDDDRPAAGTLADYKSRNSDTPETPSPATLNEYKESHPKRPIDTRNAGDAMPVRVVDHDPSRSVCKQVYLIDFDGRKPTRNEKRKVEKRISITDRTDAEPVVLIDPDSVNDKMIARRQADLVARMA